MGNKLGSEGLKEITDALLHNSRFEELYLADNQIGGDIEEETNTQAMESLGKACEASSSALKVVDLEMNK
jgi:hypothetical protein